eukprot:2071447-Amphidinium_carterae.1
MSERLADEAMGAHKTGSDNIEQKNTDDISRYSQFFPRGAHELRANEKGRRSDRCSQHYLA